MKLSGTTETLLLIAGAAVCYGLYRLYGVWIDGDGTDAGDREDEEHGRQDD